MQRKLAVGSSHDPLEHEADRIAEHVMRMPDPTSIEPSNSSHASQGQCSGGASSSGECDECRRSHEGTPLRSASATPEARFAPPIVHDVLRSAGQPLEVSTREFFEPRLGRDLSNVRTHTGPQASQSARAVNALAYAAGNDIVFNQGAYSPSTTQGRRLLAHELTHVAQQCGGLHGTPTLQRQEQSQSQNRSQAQPQGNVRDVALHSNCSDADARMIGLAALNAQRMLQAALDWFRMSTPESDLKLNALLRSHFGSDSDATRSSVHARMVKVSAILEEATKGNVNLNCADPRDAVCSKREYYAYVTPGQGYRINFCRAFFGPDMNPEERIWGIIHESFHVAGAHGDNYIFNFGEYDTNACYGQDILVASPLENADSYMNFIWCLVRPGSIVHPVKPISQTQGPVSGVAEA